ncbi:hypothetical protein [Curtobacterium sp. PhB115]|uniref:hypothetical protein n=1 Tax=Curtobacterium sp. PhB115 TaxID=2485173 RepID=UPI000FC30D0A|nr:hypothetical protein [Curtobacterium sp. PhB115]ROP64131.1 hypothetical protein EDF19_3076 [Curtobacterium sp. PhB115]
MLVVADGVDIEFDGHVCTLRARSRFSSWIIGGRERVLTTDDIGHLAYKRRRNGSVSQLSFDTRTGRLDLTFTNTAAADTDALIDALLHAGLKEVRRIKLFAPTAAPDAQPVETPTPTATDAEARRAANQRFVDDLVALLRSREDDARTVASVSTPRRIRLTLVGAERGTTR